MEDIFEIQEEVAEKIVEGLKIHLSSVEKNKLTERGTESSEADELYLRALEYFQRLTQDGIRISVQLVTDAIEQDPEYALAIAFKAIMLTTIYQMYDSNPDILSEAESLCITSLRLKPDLFHVFYPLSVVYALQGNLDKGEETAKEFIRSAPEQYLSHFSLGIFYGYTKQHAKAITPFEEVIWLKPDFRPALYNVVNRCNSAKETERREKWAHIALPVYERHLKLQPDDENCHMGHATLKYWGGLFDDAHREAMVLKNGNDSNVLFHAALLLSRLNQKREALDTFRKAIELGFRSFPHLMSFLIDDTDGVAQLGGTPEYEELKQMVEKIEAELHAPSPGAA